jgi:hypothetical protein
MPARTPKTPKVSKIPKAPSTRKRRTIKIPRIPKSLKPRNNNPRTVLSFDVGSRNLAFCVLRQCPSDSTVIDLTEGHEESESSSSSSGNPGSSAGPLDTHIDRWEVIDIIQQAGSTAKNSKNISIENLVRYMIRTLNIFFTHENMANITDVVIEQQLRKGPKNVALSYTLMSYFLVKFAHLDNKVHLISAKQKFRIIEYTIPDVVKAEVAGGLRPTGFSKKAQGLRYRSNKRLGKAAITKELESGHLLLTDDIRAKFKGGKRDDLADCLLQALVLLHPEIDLIPTQIPEEFKDDESEVIDDPNVCN